MVCLPLSRFWIGLIGYPTQLTRNALCPQTEEFHLRILFSGVAGPPHMDSLCAALCRYGNLHKVVFKAADIEAVVWEAWISYFDVRHAHAAHSSAAVLRSTLGHSSNFHSVNWGAQRPPEIPWDTDFAGGAGRFAPGLPLRTPSLSFFSRTRSGRFAPVYPLRSPSLPVFS